MANISDENCVLLERFRLTEGDRFVSFLRKNNEDEKNKIKGVVPSRTILVTVAISHCCFRNAIEVFEGHWKYLRHEERKERALHSTSLNSRNQGDSETLQSALK